MAKASVDISVDVEADGPIPGRYSMISIGACVAGRHDGDVFTALDPTRQTFYRELEPISGVAERTMPEHLLSDRQHTHNALDDAIEQGEMFAKLITAGR